ncbi:MAG: M20/M25/M40 family metallo-hydrolase [Candidatus Paceibacterota bacterium]
MKHDSIFEQYEALLSDYIAFKSISTDPAYKGEIQKTVNWLKTLFIKNKFSVQFIQGPNTNPVLLAEYYQPDDLETVLVYGHYDVQPADNDGWISDPFTLTERDDRLYGRGVVDNKGQNLIHLVTIFDLIEKGELKYNIKFMLEGNEETGNQDMSDLVRQNAELLKADYYLVSDGEIVADIPTLEVSLRGGMNVKLSIQIAKNDFHSGLCGGAVPNPILFLADFVSKLKNTETGEVLITDFYDGVSDMTAEQLENLERMPSDSEVIRMLGVKNLSSELGQTFYSQVGLRPTIEFTGFGSGYTGEGFQNIIPGKAEVRINFRFVAGQNIQRIYNNFLVRLRSLIPSYFEYIVEATKPYGPVVVNSDSVIAKNTLNLLSDSYGKYPIIKYVGGGIPIVLDFKDTLGKDTLLVSLGNEDCNMHGANENFELDLIKKGLKFSRSFFQK